MLSCCINIFLKKGKKKKQPSQNRNSIGAELEIEVTESHHRKNGWRYLIKSALDRLAARVSQVNKYN